jgi:hypothetical protein
MHYEIEVNVGRKQSPPAWTAMLNNNDENISVWNDDGEARAFMQNDSRDLRLIRVDGERRDVV